MGIIPLTIRMTLFWQICNILLDKGFKMWYKVWTVLKLAICLTVGPALLCGISQMVFGDNGFSIFMYIVAVFVWANYCFNCYFPIIFAVNKKPNKKKMETKTEDNEVDLEDLK